MRRALGLWTDSFDATRNNPNTWYRGRQVGSGPPNGELEFHDPQLCGVEYLKLGYNSGTSNETLVRPSSLDRRSTLMRSPLNVSYLWVRSPTDIWKDELSNHLVTGTYSPFSESPYLFDSSLIKDNVHKKVRSKAEALWDLSVSAGEIGESGRMVKNALDALTGEHNKYTRIVNGKLDPVIKVIKKGKVNPLKIAEAVADSFLLWRFGIETAVKDVQSAAEAVAGLSINDRDTAARSSNKTKDDANTTRSNHIVSTKYLGNIYGSIEIAETIVEKYVYKAGMELVSDRGQISAHDFIGGVDLTNPKSMLNTAYNLIPMSWLWDYFLNVGDFVSAYTFDPRKVTNGYFVELLERTIHIDVLSFDKIDPAYSSPQWSGGQSSFKFLLYNRATLLPSYMQPSRLRVEVPSILQATTAAALGTSLLLKPKIESVKLDPRVRGEVRSLTKQLITKR